jgi:NAD(P)-dependent dehydrogenase (short-subunit alcohol dehydrogenase family)
MTESSYGRIVGVAGQNALLTGNVTGSVRNAALIIAAKNLADSVAGTGVTVNTVSPGMVREDPTPQVRSAQAGEVRPTDVAALIAFLVSPIAGAVSGESIAVGHRVHGVTSM